MPNEYDYVTGQGKTVSWKRVSDDLYNVWVYGAGEKTQIGNYVEDWERRRLIFVYTGLSPIRDLTR